jgi:hypothetical protein
MQQSRKKRLGMPIEMHAESIYTREMHNRFYNELYEAGSYTILDKSVSGQSFTVVHNNELDKTEPRKFKVQLDGIEKIHCTCGLYEHAGMNS